MIGELAQNLKPKYLAVIAEETVLPLLSSQSLPIYIVEEEDDTLPTFLEPTALLLESVTCHRGDEALLTPNTLLIGTGAQTYYWLIINKLDVPITLPLGLHIGNVKLQSAEIACMVHFLSPTDQDLRIQLYKDIQPQLTDPVQIDETDDTSISTHPSMPDLKSMTSENEDDVNPSPLPRFPDWFRRAVQNPPNVSRESAESLEFEDELQS